MSPMVIEEPSVIRDCRERGEPVPHFRNFHWRRFPIKADGTRKKGAVFVHECFVKGAVSPEVVV